MESRGEIIGEPPAGRPGISRRSVSPTMVTYVHVSKLMCDKPVRSLPCSKGEIQFTSGFGAKSFKVDEQARSVVIEHRLVQIASQPGFPVRIALLLREQSTQSRE